MDYRPCPSCGRSNNRPTILNTCAECDPELHAAWEKAADSVVDDETVTEEMVIAYQLLEERKAKLQNDPLLHGSP